jgi:hypothetical protein
MNQNDPPQLPSHIPGVSSPDVVILEPRESIRGPFRNAYIDDRGNIVPYGPVIEEKAEILPK